MLVGVMLVGVMLVGVLFVLLPGPLASETVSCGSVPPIAQSGGTKEEKLDQLLRRTIARIRERKPQVATDIFSEMISVDPSNETAYLNRTNASIQTGNLLLASPT